MESRVFIKSFQEEFAKLLGVSVEKTEAVRQEVRRAIIEQYLNGMAFLLRNDHDLPWKVLFMTAESLYVQRKRITIQELIRCIGPKYIRKLDRKISNSRLDSLHAIDKTPSSNKVQILQGGLTGVGGRNSRRNRGSDKR
jgi:hypothetical protein